MYKTFKTLTPPLIALLAFGFAADAQAAKAVVWKKPVTKTLVVKQPGKVVKVRTTKPTRVRVVHAPRRRVYSGVHVHRHHGHSYFGFGYYGDDAAAFAFLGLTALTLAILDDASEAQQRAHEQAFVEATRLPAGERITWNDGPASGDVTVVRSGNAPNGQPCREFQQTVTIDGDSETAYGIACRQKDGAWRIVD